MSGRGCVDFSRPTARSAEGLLYLDCVCVCVCVCVPHFEACDWSTRFMRVITLGLSSVNRFCSTEWDTEKCVKVVYKSVHVCYSCLVNQDVKEELYDDHDHENEIDKSLMKLEEQN